MCSFELGYTIIWCLYYRTSPAYRPHLLFHLPASRCLRMGGAERVRHYATRVTTEVGAWTHQVKSLTNAGVKLSRLKRIQRSWFLIALRSQETSGEHAMSGLRALFSGCRGSRGGRIFHRKLLSQNFPSNTGCSSALAQHSVTLSFH